MEMNQNGELGFQTLPEGCIAHVLSQTSPRDACQLSAVSNLFNPPPIRTPFGINFYRPITVTLLADRSILLPFPNSPPSNICISIYPITPSSLTVVPRFEEVAELRLVWWLEIWGKINTCLLSADTIYAAFLVYKLTDDAYGFKPAEVSIMMIGDECETQSAILYPTNSKQRYRREKETSKGGRDANAFYPKRREDGWLEVGLGEFFNKRGEDGELEMSLKEVNVYSTKGGLIVEGIEIMPKEVNQNCWKRFCTKVR